MESWTGWARTGRSRLEEGVGSSSEGPGTQGRAEKDVPESHRAHRDRYVSTRDPGGDEEGRFGTESDEGDEGSVAAEVGRTRLTELEN